MGTDGRSAVTTRLMRRAALWLALMGCGNALAHVTTTGLLRIDVAGGRVLYALSVALPELPAASASTLFAAANGDRASAEAVAQTARGTGTVAFPRLPLRAGGGAHPRAPRDAAPRTT